MFSKWRKAKLALGLCVYVPRPRDEAETALGLANGRFSESSTVSPATTTPLGLDYRPATPMTPTPSSNGLMRSKSSSRSSKKTTCSICLGSMKPGQGLAIFTGECGHSFHFQCITSNVKHGNQLCPVCRAKWKEIPSQGPSAEAAHDRARINPNEWGVNDDQLTPPIRRFQTARANSSRHVASLFHSSEPNVFDDDDAIDTNPVDKATEKSFAPMEYENAQNLNTVEIKTCLEFSAINHSKSRENFALLIHLKAPIMSSKQSSIEHANSSVPSLLCRAPVDLVTVLDVSGSMAGTKLALLKRAMGFVIQNLGPSDRLCVIAFSSTARRLFPLRRMSDAGKQQALQAVHSLISSGGTNIAEGLRKGAKVMEDRKSKNSVCSIILLSDGQDTYTITSSSPGNPQPNYQSLLPSSISRGTGSHIPVHAFGFGIDHDAASMLSIAETSGGTFSFIETESVIQDAFAQCIGGLLSVVVQELQVSVDSSNPKVKISSIKAGSYTSRVFSEGRAGSIEVGDLYAEEERDFLLLLDLPADDVDRYTSLVKIGCSYNNPISNEKVSLDGQEVKIQRVDNAARFTVSTEVDRQRNRLQAAEAMADSCASAERGDLAAAVTILENCRKLLASSASARARDQLWIALDAELKEMQERMASRRIYESSGRAYMLSGLSSHSWQRATARGDSTDSASLVHAYQTPSMVYMLSKSQTMPFGSSSSRPPVRPARSFSQQPQPR